MPKGLDTNSVYFQKFNNARNALTEYEKAHPEDRESSTYKNLVSIFNATDARLELPGE